MQTSVTHSHQRSFLTKYKTRITRLQKAIQQEACTGSSAGQRRQLLLGRGGYERGHVHGGIDLADVAIEV